MNPSLWISKTGLSAQDKQMSVISNNLANVNTVGFKRDRVSFEDLFYNVERQPGALSDQQNVLPSGLQLGSGVRITGTQKIFTPGSYQTTSQSLDMAIVGNGFFKVLLPTGEPAYTRNGQFHLNTDGGVVTASGLPLEPAIEIPPGAQNVSISNDGIVMVSLPGQVDPLQVGQINLVSFVNPAGLASRGGNLYLQTASSGAANESIPGLDGLGEVKQFTLEGSNVSVVEELVNMISVQRAYEMNSKAISAADEMMKYANQVL